jgi:hypothetical protein
MNTEFEYLRVEVSRTEVTELYLKVPKGWKPTGVNSKILGTAAKETTSDMDWDNDGWEDSVEFQGCSPVDEKEALLYKVFEVKP